MEGSSHCSVGAMEKIRTGVCILCLLAAATSAGCINSPVQTAHAESPPAVIVDYHRTGGIAGLDDRLVIFDNGAAIVSSRMSSREINLTRTDLDRISSVFSDAQFTMLESNYTARLGTDLIHYSISYRGKTVNTEDSATPPQLQLVIDELNRVLRAGGFNQQVNPLGSIPVSMP